MSTDETLWEAIEELVAPGRGLDDDALPEWVHVDELHRLLAEHPATPAEGSHHCTDEPCPYWCLRPKAEEPAEVAVEEREACPVKWCAYPMPHEHTNGATPEPRRLTTAQREWLDDSMMQGFDALVLTVETLLRDHDAALTAKAKAEALREAADEHEAQLVCCDIYERLHGKPSRDWADAEREEMRGHAICYWGAACAEGDHERADRHTTTTGAHVALGEHLTNEETT